MFGIKSSGCFMIGIFVGFLAAVISGIIIYFFFNPEEKDENMDKVEKVWKKVKDNGDHYIKVIKETPVPKSPVSIRKEKK